MNLAASSALVLCFVLPTVSVAFVQATGIATYGYAVWRFALGIKRRQVAIYPVAIGGTASLLGSTANMLSTTLGAPSLAQLELTGHVAFAIGMAASLALSFVESLRASRRFVPAEFLAALGKEEVTEVHRGDTAQREMTVMFADVRDFTRRSEQRTPQENIAWLNRYLSTVEPTIHAHRGFVNQYYGDGLMALFSSADDAVSAASAMLDAVETAGDKLREGGEPIRLAIGLHTGSIMMGTIGGLERLDTGVVGDTVNTAARIEAAAKKRDRALLISAATKTACTSDLGFEEVDRVTPKGKTEEIVLFGLTSN